MISPATFLTGEHLWTLLVILVLASWFLASIIHQFRFRLWTGIAARFDPFNLLPNWTFFAPNPGRHDFHVVYRDWMNESQCSEWTELTTFNVETTGWRCLWNPSRYPSKAVSDLANGLYRVQQLYQDAPRVVLLSNPYLCLLQTIMTQPSASGAVDRRQFAIVRTRGFGSDRVIEVTFVSEVHRAAL